MLWGRQIRLSPRLTCIHFDFCLSESWSELRRTQIRRDQFSLRSLRSRKRRSLERAAKWGAFVESAASGDRRRPNSGKVELTNGCTYLSLRQTDRFHRMWANKPTLGFTQSEPSLIRFNLYSFFSLLCFAFLWSDSHQHSDLNLDF